jgi:hypothetical protein
MGAESVVAVDIERLKDEDDAEEDDDDGCGRRKLVLVPSSNLPFSITPSASTRKPNEIHKSPQHH